MLVFIVFVKYGPHKLNPNQAANMATFVGCAYAIGRLFSIFFTIRGNVGLSIYGSVIVILSAYILLAFNILPDLLPFGKMTILTALSFMFGLGYSALYPNSIVFVEQRVCITNQLNAQMMAVSTILFSVNSYLIGDQIESRPELFIILNSSFHLLFLLLFVLFHSTDLLKKKLLNKTN